jgi:hypothetical protein
LICYRFHNPKDGDLKRLRPKANDPQRHAGAERNAGFANLRQYIHRLISCCSKAGLGLLGLRILAAAQQLYRLALQIGRKRRATMKRRGALSNGGKISRLYARRHKTDICEAWA